MPIIGSNIAASSAATSYARNTEQSNQSLTRLAAGSRLATPTSDAAGVAVSARLDSVIQSLSAVSQNSSNIVSLAQTTDGALSTVQSSLTRLSELAQRSTDGTLGDSERAIIQREFDTLRNQIDTFTGTAQFNGTNLFQDQTVTTSVDSQGNTADFELTEVSTNSLGIDSLDISTQAGAQNAITALNDAIGTVTTRRAEVNADVNRFQFYSTNAQTEQLNVQESNSRIRDLDVAAEVVNNTRNNILGQASLAAIVQANSSQSSVLSLLR